MNAPINYGWCAKGPLAKDGSYMQVNAGKMVKWVAIDTKGRYSGQYVKSYKVKYSINGRDFIPLLDNPDFTGNYDGTTSRYNKITLPTKALALRIYPQTWQRWASMNLNAYYLEETRFDVVRF